MAFSDLGLSGKVLQAVESSGYTQPTPIQSEAIPHVLARRDVLGIAQTGTGKTAAFTLPMLTLLETGRARARMPRTLILEPTRELAAQVEESFIKYGVNHRLNVALLIGGVSFNDQDAKITRGADVLIATPGRLLDHIERGKLLLSGIEVLVIDEADRMLDMGFIPDIERICKMVPFTRQTLFFSATMPPEIQRLVDNFLSNPVRIEVAPGSSTAHTITQLAVASGADAPQKRQTLRRLIRGAEDLKNGIIFCNRKRDIAVVLRSLEKHGFSVAALHGDMDQRSRMQALDGFRNNDVQLLIASDVAARGLDIPDVSHVFNYDTPHHAEDYVHRIGRTGRAGRTGTAYTIVTPDDSKNAAAIVALIGKEFDWLGDTEAEAGPAASLSNGDDNTSRERRSDRRRDKDGKRGRDGRRRDTVDAGDAQVAEQPRVPEKAAQEPRQDSRPQAPTEVRNEKREDKREEKREALPEARSDKREGRNAGRNGQRDERRSGNGRHERDEPCPPGFGEHTPAFMLTKATLPQRSPTAKRSEPVRESGPITPIAILPEHDRETAPREAAPQADARNEDGQNQDRARHDRRSRDRRSRKPASDVAVDASAMGAASGDTTSGHVATEEIAVEPVVEKAIAPAAVDRIVAPTPVVATPQPAVARPVEAAPVATPAAKVADTTAADAVAPVKVEAEAKPKRVRAPRKTTAAADKPATPVKKAAAPRKKPAAKAEAAVEEAVVSPDGNEAGEGLAKAAPADAPAPAKKRAPRKAPAARKAVSDEPATADASGVVAANTSEPLAEGDALQVDAGKAARPARTRTRRSARTTPRASDAAGDDDTES